MTKKSKNSKKNKTLAIEGYIRGMIDIVRKEREPGQNLVANSKKLKFLRQQVANTKRAMKYER